MNFFKLFKNSLSNPSILPNLIKEVLDTGRRTTRHADYTPFRRFANVRKVEMVLKPWDLLLEKFGIKARKGAARFEYYKYRADDPLNRYLKYQLRCLRKQRSERAYWNLVNILMKNSKVFFMLGLKHIEPR